MSRTRTRLNEARREEILRATVDLIAGVGFSAVRITVIAKRCGVSADW
jgi:AcrR family transcriptional regulator